MWWHGKAFIESEDVSEYERYGLRGHQEDSLLESRGPMSLVNAPRPHLAVNGHRLHLIRTSHSARPACTTMNLFRTLLDL